MQSDALRPSVSADGTLVCQRGSELAGDRLAWVSPTGEVEPIGDEFEGIRRPLFSPDGSRIAAWAGSVNKGDIRVRDLSRGVNSRVTFDEGLAMPASWSPDGTELAVLEFDPTSDARIVTRFVYADGSGESRPPVTGGMMTFDAAWVRAAMVPAITPTDDQSVFAVQIDSPDERVEVGTLGLRPFSLALRPDGSLLAYHSDESGHDEVYCIRFPGGSGKWQVSRDGGQNPVWSADGKQLYYLGLDESNMIYEVDVSEGPSLHFGVPREAMDMSVIQGDLGPASWAPEPGGERFVVVESASEESKSRSSISIIQHWAAEFTPE